jgi:hypothetical protein
MRRALARLLRWVMAAPVDRNAPDLVFIADGFSPDAGAPLPSPAENAAPMLQ